MKLTCFPESVCCRNQTGVLREVINFELLPGVFFWCLDVVESTMSYKGIVPPFKEVLKHDHSASGNTAWLLIARPVCRSERYEYTLNSVANPSVKKWVFCLTTPHDKNIQSMTGKLLCDLHGRMKLRWLSLLMFETPSKRQPSNLNRITQELFGCGNWNSNIRKAVTAEGRKNNWEPRIEKEITRRKSEKRCRKKEMRRRRRRKKLNRRNKIL